MLKRKYLHRKSRNTTYDKSWTVKKYKRSNTIDLFSDLPKHQKIGPKNKYSNYDLTPLKEFILSKIGQNWNDVYSEILTKIDKKMRYEIDQALFGSWSGWLISNPIYDEDFIPRNKYGRILSEYTFVDMNNIITNKCEHELISDAKKFVRRQKMKELLDKMENYEID